MISVNTVVESYRSSQTLPRKCHLNWLKENFNPILYDIDESLNINWGCQTCARNYMSMITRYLDEQAIIKAEQDEEAERIALQDMINEEEKINMKKKIIKKPKKKASGNTKKSSSNYKGAESR